MTDATKTAIRNTVSALFYAGRIHDVCIDDDMHDCMGCPFRSHYIDHPTNDESEGFFYKGICETESLWLGCAKWENDMGNDL